MKTAENTIQARRCYSTVSQSMSAVNLYSDLFGDVRPASAGAAPAEGFYVLSYKPWLLQVQEQDDDGAWCLISTERFPRKDQALAAAARQGIDLDYVSHERDDVRGYVIPGREAP